MNSRPVYEVYMDGRLICWMHYSYCSTRYSPTHMVWCEVRIDIVGWEYVTYDPNYVLEILESGEVSLQNVQKHSQCKQVCG